jgi:hypothetical protein
MCTLLAVAALLSACGSEMDEGGSASGLSTDAARALVIRASAMPKAPLDAIISSGAAVRPEDFESTPLTCALLFLRMDQDTSDDLQWVRGQATTPKDLASGFMDLEGSMVSIVNEKTVKSVTWEEQGTAAHGTVSFEVPDVVKAKLEFRAENRNDGWHVMEFSCPSISFRTTLGADGRWTYTRGD